jgi:hypothetical protein
MRKYLVFTINFESPIEIVSVIKWDLFVNVSTILWSNEDNLGPAGCVTNTSMSELAVAPRITNSS